MNIWTIVIGEPSQVDGPDTRMLRTGILSKTLAARNHQVTCWDSTFDYNSKTQRFDKTTTLDIKGIGAQVFLKGPGYTSNKSLKRVLHHMIVARAFAKAAQGLPLPDVIVCSYPPMEIVEAVRKFALAQSIPFILDFRDMWPDIIIDMAPRLFRPVVQICMLPWYFLLRKSVRAATGIVAISAPFLEWACAKGGRQRGASDRVFHLANEGIEYSPESLNSARAFWKDKGVDGTKLIVAFVGKFSTRVDVGTVIRAAWLLSSRAKERIQIVICGTGEGEKELHRIAENEPHIVLAGWRNQAEIQALLGLASVGLLPYPSHPDFLMSFPNKFGEYLSWGLPVVTCLGGEVERLLAENQCGYMYTALDPLSLANVLENLIGDSDAISQKGSNAKRVYDHLFNSQQIYAEFSDYVEKVARLVPNWRDEMVYHGDI